MKRIPPVLIALCCATVTAYAQIAAPPYALTARGPHHRVSEAPDARPGAPPHRIVELATGMHYWDDQEKTWKPSEPVFSTTAEGFLATRVQHAARIAPDLNVRGAVALKTPGGILLQSTPLCIALFDTASGAFQVIGTITNSQGILLTNRDQVWFPSSFAGVCADLVYTISQDAFEQDLVLTAKLDPLDWGLPRATTVIQIWTEFYQPEQPDILREPRYIEQDAARRQVLASPDVIEEILTWDELRFGEGRAYTTPSLTHTNGTWAGVVKEYRTMNQRQFVVESVPFAAIADALQALPDCVPPGSKSAMLENDRTRSYALIPSSPPAQAKIVRSLAPIRLSQALFATRPCVTIDYRATLTGGSGVLQSDTTYLVSGGANFSSLKIEGGAVVKYKYYSSVGASSITCATSPMRPAVFTAVDDDTVGETMNGYTNSGYTGTINPAGYAISALTVPSGSTVSNCRFCYAQVAVANSSSEAAYSLTVTHAQFVNCIKGISLSSTGGGGSGPCAPSSATFTLNNVLMSNVQTPLSLPSCIASGGYSLAHATIHRSDRIYSERV